MTKTDLKSGMMVELRNKQRYIVLLNASSGDLLVNVSMVYNSVQKTYPVMLLYNYGDNLIPSLPNSKPYGNNTDITKVFNFEKTDDALDSSRYVLLWERLQVVGFIEAFKAYREQKIIKSVVTGHKYSSLYGIGVTIINATNEEIDSTWIILKGSETSEL